MILLPSSVVAGGAHINLGKQNDLTCIGAYPNGHEYDIKRGHSDGRQ